MENRDPFLSKSARYVVMLMLSIAGAIVPGAPVFAQSMSGPAADSGIAGEGTSAATVADRTIHIRGDGPWGRLESFHAFLEAPDHLIDGIALPSMTTVWRFPEMTRAEAEALIRRVGLVPEVEQELFANLGWQELEDEVRAFPHYSVLRKLNPIARSALYGILGQWRQNPYHWAPVFIHSSTVREWFDGVGLSEAALSAIEDMAYPFGDSLAFSDIPWLMGLDEGDRAERRIMKSMTRTRTIMLRFHKPEADEIEAMTTYWGAAGRTSEVGSLLESLRWVEGVEQFDLAYLLPPLARRHMFTFPSFAGAGLSGVLPDARWTATNFFRHRADEPDPDPAGFLSALERHYVPVSPPYAFGDILVLERVADGPADHADTRLPEAAADSQVAVHIADGIVYTRIGRQMLKPWILLELDELAGRFIGGNGGRWSVVAWRLKAPGSG